MRYKLIERWLWAFALVVAVAAASCASKTADSNANDELAANGDEQADQVNDTQTDENAATAANGNAATAVEDGFEATNNDSSGSTPNTPVNNFRGSNNSAETNSLPIPNQTAGVNAGINALLLDGAPANAATSGNSPALNSVPTDATAVAPAVSAPSVQAAALPIHETYPVNATLRWVGYDFVAASKQLKVELIVEGKPKFEVFQEKNQADQPELVIRYLGTELRRKVRRPIDASEFRSPVAYIRMREDKADNHVDVVVTLRDEVRPRLFAKNGNVQLTFAIPAKYQGTTKKGTAIERTPAELLAKANVMPELDPASELPQTMLARAFVPNQTGQTFKGAPADGGSPLEQTLAPEATTADGKGLPSSFNAAGSTNNVPAESFAPANGSEANAVDTTLNENAAYGNANVPSNNAAPKSTAKKTAKENEKSDSVQSDDSEDTNTEEPSTGDDAAYEVTSFSLNGVAQDDGGLDFGAKPADDGTIANGFSVDDGQGATEKVKGPDGGAIDVVGQESLGLDDEGDGGQYGGRPISVEFHKAPLALVLKTFSEESGNNFIYPEDVANVDVTIFLKKVPWDEALKAILETNGLGMVKVGARVVRIDKLENLTKYLEALEKTKNFKTKMTRTKILVVRLSHASAKTVVAGLIVMLATSKTIDPRIIASADERTNSVVVEAPPAVLGKVKNIIERLDLETPQVEITSRIVEVARSASNFLGVVWQNSFNFDPGRALGFGSLVFPNSFSSEFAVDPGVKAQATPGVLGVKFGSLNKFVDLDLLLKMEERRGTTNILQSNRVLVLDREKAKVLAGTKQYFRPPAGGIVVGGGGAAGGGGGAPGGGGGAGGGGGLAEVDFNLELEVTPEISADGNVNMDIHIISDAPSDPSGESLAGKNTRELTSKMARKNGDTAVIGGIYDTKKTKAVVGIPYLSRIPIIGALFRSTATTETQLELLVMVTPNLVSSSAGSAQIADSSGFAPAGNAGAQSGSAAPLNGGSAAPPAEGSEGDEEGDKEGANEGAI